jgi:uncharacterized protein
MFRSLFATLLALTFLNAYPAYAERRLGLVVGIAEYRELPGIVRSAADARAVSQSLTEIGFEVDLVLEPDGRGLDEAAERFTSSLREGDIGLFFFAGHAARIRGEFTILPADAPALGTPAEEGKRVFGLALSALVDDMKAAGARAQVIIIDACRGDPYVGDSQELAPSSCGDVGQQLAEGTVALFSASSGQKALDRLGPDDRNAHSVFTRVLLPQLREPRSITRIARLVRDEVVEVAARVRYEQRPAYLDELTGPSVVLAPRRQEAAIEPIPVPPTLEAPVREPLARGRLTGIECGSVSPGPPAFDCRSARRMVEVAICRDPRLGSCDRVLSVVFFRAQEVVGRGASRLRREEDAWVARRDTCEDVAGQGPDALASCIRRAYEERIAELQQIVGSPPPATAQTPSFNCASARTRVEETICTDPALAAKDRQMSRLYAGAARASDAAMLSQREWLAARDQCNRLDGSELRACTHRAYDARIRELRNPVAFR